MNEQELDQLTERLRAVGNRVDPVPAAVSAAARAAFAWRAIDVELAELTYDSVVDEAALAGVRGRGGTRQLTFEAPGLTVEVEVGAADGLHLVGQLVPAHAGTVEVRHGGGSQTVVVDDLGRFTTDRLPAGPLSLRCSAAAAAPVDTEWVAV